jgi:hypothetical protein
VLKRGWRPEGSGEGESGKSGEKRMKKNEKRGASKMNIFPCMWNFTQQLYQKVLVISEREGRGGGDDASA